MHLKVPLGMKRKNVRVVLSNVTNFSGGSIDVMVFCRVSRVCNGSFQSLMVAVAFLKLVDDCGAIYPYISIFILLYHFLSVPMVFVT